MARELPIRNGRLTTDLDAAGHKIKNLPPGEGFTQAQADWNQTDATAPDFIKNKPTIPAPVTVDSALSPVSENPVQNRVVTEAVNARPTKAEIDAGWWSGWTFSGEEPPSGSHWGTKFSPFATQWNLFALPDGTSIDDYTDIQLGEFLVEGTSSGYSADETELTFGRPSVTATRHRVAAPVPMKPEDIGAQPAGSYATAAQGAKADAALSRAEVEAGFTEWKFNKPGSYVVIENEQVVVVPGDKRWKYVLNDATHVYLDARYEDDRQTSIDWSSSVSGLISTRTRLPTMSDIPTGSTSMPEMDADGGPGTSDRFAREDHIHPHDSSKADKSEMSVTPGTGANADKTTIQLKTGTIATVLTSHQAWGDVKPSGGIPKTDLASAVQTSLGFADTAIQPPGIAGLMQMYGFETATAESGTLTVQPYRVCTCVADSTAVAFEVAVGALPAGVSGKARDCILVIDCTATGAVAPTVTWPSNFHPRTDTATDLAIVEAGKRAVFYISEYAAGEFAVGGWVETEGET